MCTSSDAVCNTAVCLEFVDDVGVAEESSSGRAVHGMSCVKIYIVLK